METGVEHQNAAAGIDREAHHGNLVHHATGLPIEQAADIGVEVAASQCPQLHEPTVTGLRVSSTIAPMARFGRVLSAMVTPFDGEGALDLDAAKVLARYLQDHGNDGLVIAGTTGEAPTLSDDERLALFAAVIETVTIPVIAGTGTNDTRHSVHLTKQAKALGAAGILAVCPYYNRPSQAGIEAHMRAIAAAGDLPVVIYDIPVRTGRKISTATLADAVPRGSQHRRLERCRR